MFVELGESWPWNLNFKTYFAPPLRCKKCSRIGPADVFGANQTAVRPEAIKLRSC